jgi:co-chaperonin GroES (HSP10)
MRLSKKLNAIRKAVRPLRDRVLIQRLDYQHPTLAVVGVTLEKGVVVAIGYGRRLRRKVRFNHSMNQLNTERAIFFEDGGELGKIRPMRVKVGDVVEFSPRNYIEWDFMGERLLWVWENAIYGIDPLASKSKALLWQQSAGYDRKGNYLSGEENWTRASGAA